MVFPILSLFDRQDYIIVVIQKWLNVTFGDRNIENHDNL